MNLDLECAKAGQGIAASGVDENTIRNGLGVLQEHGLYAFFLYCRAKGATMISDKAKLFLEEMKLLAAASDGQDFFDSLRESFNNDLQKLLLAKELLERTLVYARYHAKGSAGPASDGGLQQGVGQAEPAAKGG